MTNKEPKFLLFDTATTQATACVAFGMQIKAVLSKEVTTHSEGLLPMIDDVLTQAACKIDQLDAIIIGIGPGSYTGLRIGLSTAKGLAYAAKRPLIAIHSLVALAEAANQHYGDQRKIGVILDARRKEVFAALAIGGMIAEESVTRVEHLVDEWRSEKELILIGDGALAYQDELLQGIDATLAADELHALDARYLLKAAYTRFKNNDFDTIEEVVPRYLRSPDIRKGKPKAHPDLSSSPQTLTPVEMSSEDQELLEELRQSGLRLDWQGRFWHEDKLVEHEGVKRALHRWIDQLDDGRFIIRLDAQRYAYFEVEDTPYVVRTVEIEGNAIERRIFLILSDQSREELDYGSLRENEDGILYCRVKARFDARFMQQAQLLIAQTIEETSVGGFELVANSKRYIIS